MLLSSPRRTGAPSPSTRSRLSVEVLEDRSVPAGVPILHSLPGAPVSLYMDFDGHGTNTPYDIDGNPSDFNATEVSQITEAWRQIANYFAIFNVDVTTEFDSRPRAWHLSSNSISGGYAFVASFPSNTGPTGFNQSADVRTRQSGIAHEFGHILGLQHIGDYDLLGNLVNEYSSGFDARHGPLMGVDFAQSIHKFFYGRPANSVSALQDDIARIAQELRTSPGGVITAGNEFRADDHSGAFASATSLAVGQTRDGILERMTDADAFSFTATGPVTLNALRVDPSGVDLKLTVFDSGGVLIAEADPVGGTGTTSNNATLTLQLAAGTYYAVVSSHGDYADLGMYTLSLANASPVSPPTYNALPAPSGFTLGLGTGTAVTLSWNAVAGATGYTVSRSADGVTYTQIATPTGTTHTDTGVTASQRWFYQVQARSGTTNSAPSTAHIVNRPAAPFNITLTRLSGGTAAVLNWRDVAGDNGYRVERSTDGTTWTTVATLGTNVPGYTQTGLIASTRYLYRVFATSAQGDSLASAVVATDNALGVNTSSVTMTQVALRWSPVIGSRYRVERSTDGGATYGALTTTTATTYTDTTVASGTTYIYRVMAETSAATPVARSPWSHFTVTTPGTAPLGVINGGFELPNLAAGDFAYTPSGATWTFSSSTGVAADGSAFTDGNPNAPGGDQVAFVQGQGTVTQTVNLAAGTYAVTFLAAQRGNFNPGGNQTIRVLVGGVAVGEFTPSGTGYESFISATFTVPTNGSRVVTFQGLVADDTTAFLDSVQVVAVSVNLLANGGFEAPAVGAGQFAYTPSGATWSFSGGAGIAANGSGFTDGNPNAPQGTQVLFLQGQGSVSQALTGLAAGTYTVTFVAAQRGNFNPGGNQTIRVQFAGQSQTFTPTGTGYQSFTTTFTVSTAGNYTLVFDGLVADDSTAFLDDIALTRVS